MKAVAFDTGSLRSTWSIARERLAVSMNVCSDGETYTDIATNALLSLWFAGLRDFVSNSSRSGQNE
jgi:hypothetical protein